MSRHLEKILAHAERQLSSSQRPTEILPVYRRFLKLEEHRLRLHQNAGAGGRDVCSRRVDLVDVLLRHVFAAAHHLNNGQSASAEIALLALGGYGRRELNPSSDVDVMFLHRENAVSKETQQIVEQVLYLLWDIGFKVGHSTRTIKGAVSAANEDMHTKTALLEARFLVGDQLLADTFRAQFRSKCVIGHEREYIELRMRDQAARHAKFGNSVYLQEPNLKNSCGGLRDYQNLLWMTFFKDGTLTTNHLVAKDWLSEPDRRRLETAYDFMLRVRTELHYLTGRATDVLHMNMQEELALRLKYPARQGLLRSEAMMKDVFAHARNIFRVTERVTDQFASGYSSPKTRSLFGFLPRAQESEEKIGSFVARQKRMDVSRRDLFLRSPNEMMRAFEIAQERDLEFTPELMDLFGRHLGVVDNPYRYATEPREIFRRILSRRGQVGRTLRLMHRVDFLGQYLPEFGQLTCLVQHEFFHRYTADEHTLLCIDKLDAVVSATETKFTQYRRLFEAMPNVFVLYLSLLLHDTGKAVGARPHSEASAVFAQKVARRLHLDSHERKMLILLVDHHVTLSNIAQRRNIDDDATIAEFAAIVRTQENLDALMLLTLADGQGTSNEGWSDWKEALVWQLYRATSQYLADRHAFSDRLRNMREEREQTVKNQLGAEYTDEIEAHFEQMPDHYFRAFAAPEIVEHIELLRAFYQATVEGPDPLEPVIRWRTVADEGHSVLSVCTWDRPQLLAKIAGAISAVPLNILGADIYTRSDHVALDVFRVCDLQQRPVIDPRDKEAVEATLRRALAAEPLDLQQTLARARERVRPKTTHAAFPTRIVADNEADPLFTLIEIQAPDRIGLLFDLLGCFFRQGVDIGLARISTEGGAAIDTFYLSDRQSRTKIAQPPRLAALQEELSRIVTEE